MTAELDRAMRQLRLTQAKPLARTAIAWVWEVRQLDGAPAILKVYLRPDRGNEAAGTALLSVWADRGAVMTYAENGPAVLVEKLSGPSLGDIARDGDVDKALYLLAQTASRLHGKKTPLISGLRQLDEVFRPLLLAEFAPDCPADLERDVRLAADLATNLLGSQPDLRPLHGDLHPDNVILTPAGPRVIDAKGYVGDPAFELANALRHPNGMPDLVRDPDQIRECAALYSEALDVSELRLLQWAAAKCALSVVWRAKGPVSEDVEADLLNQLLAQARQ